MFFRRIHSASPMRLAMRLCIANLRTALHSQCTVQVHLAASARYNKFFFWLWAGPITLGAAPFPREPGERTDANWFPDTREPVQLPCYQQCLSQGTWLQNLTHWFRQILLSVKFLSFLLINICFFFRVRGIGQFSHWQYKLLHLNSEEVDN